MTIQSCINSVCHVYSALPDPVRKGMKIGAVCIGSALILPIALKALGFYGAAAFVSGVVSVITGTITFVLTGAGMILSVGAIALIAYLTFMLLKKD